MESQMNVYQKLQSVQSELRAPKSQNNSFGNYSYRSNEDILEAVKPHLKDVGAVIVQSDQISLIGERFYVVATSCFICSETGEKVENTAYARETEKKKGMDEAQITGSASSYARKYSLNGLLSIDDNKDPDSQDNRNHGQNMAQTPKPLPEPSPESIEACIEWAVTNRFDPQKAIINLSSKYTVHPDNEAYICAEIQRRTAEEDNS